jgi:hypothetical protein
MTDFFRVGWQRAAAVFHGFEVRFSRFRQGMGNRTPDFSEFRRKAAAFFAQFSSGNPKPKANVQQAPPEPTVDSLPPTRDPEQSTGQEPRPKTDLDAKLAELDKVLIQARNRPITRPEAPPTPEEPAADPAVVIQEKVAGVGQTLSDGLSTVAATLEDLVDIVKEKAGEVGGAIQAQASALADAVIEGVSTTLESLMPPPDPPLPPPVPIPKLTEEQRREAQEYIEKHPEVPWVELPKPEESPTPVKPEVPPAIKHWDDKPKSESNFYDGKAEREAKVVPAPEPPSDPPFTKEDLERAERSVRGAYESAIAELLKEQEKRIADQNAQAAMNRKKVVPDRPRFDPTQAKKFEYWGDPSERDATGGETVVEQLPELKTEDARSAASLAGREDLPIRSDTDAAAPAKRRLPQRARVADLRKERRETEEFPNKLRRLNEDAAVRRAERKPFKLALTEQTSTKPARKPLPDSSLRPVRRVQFGDFVKESEIEVSAEERAIDAEEIVRTVHEEMRARMVQGDRFIRLMLIALDDTKLPTNRKTDPHKMAIELYRAFSKKARDRWAEQAESTIRQQLEAQPRDNALRALGPIVKYFDRYSGPPSKAERPGMQFLHQRLGQLGMILHKLQNEQASRTD